MILYSLAIAHSAYSQTISLSEYFAGALELTAMLFRTVIAYLHAGRIMPNLVHELGLLANLLGCFAFSAEGRRSCF